MYVKKCSANISQLQNLLKLTPAGSPAKRLPINTDMLAHRQGMVLLLSEKLGSLTGAFDSLRSLRYQQKAAQQAMKARRTPPPPPRHISTTATTGSSLRSRFPTTTPPSYNGTDVDGRLAASSSHHHDHHQQQYYTTHMSAQETVDAENLALQHELLSRVDEVSRAEKTVREIATLNQMFSTAILAQSEQIEQLYMEAVAATGHLERGNVQLKRAIRTNTSSRKYLFFFFLLATLGLLFLDWFYS
jgi:syntaxin 18